MHEVHLGSGFQNLNENGRGKEKGAPKGRNKWWKENMTFFCFCGRRWYYGLKVENFISQRLKKRTPENKTASCLFPLFSFCLPPVITSVLTRKGKAGACQWASTSSLHRKGALKSGMCFYPDKVNRDAGTEVFWLMELSIKPLIRKLFCLFCIFK